MVQAEIGVPAPGGAAGFGMRSPFAVRGVAEGFYGPPYTFPKRICGDALLGLGDYVETRVRQSEMGYTTAG